MAWLTLLLFFPWFVVLAGLFWFFPRHPRTPRRSWIDAALLLLALLMSIVAMHWGHALGQAAADAGAIWRQVLAVLSAYGAFLAVLCVAVWLRPRWW